MLLRSHLTWSLTRGYDLKRARGVLPSYYVLTQTIECPVILIGGWSEIQRRDKAVRGKSLFGQVFVMFAIVKKPTEGNDRRISIDLLIRKLINANLRSIAVKFSYPAIN